MKQQHVLQATLLALVVGLAGCQGGSSGSNQTETDNRFTTFVVGLFDNSATSEPVSVNDRDFEMDEEPIDVDSLSN